MADYPSTPSTTQNTATSLKRTYPQVKRTKGREQRLALGGK